MEKNIKEPLIESQNLDGEQADRRQEFSQEEQGYELAFEDKEEQGPVNKPASKAAFQRGGFNLGTLSSAVGLAVKHNKREKMGLMDMPAQTIDGAPFYFKEFNKKFIVYDARSCYCFGEHNILRKRIVWLLCHPFFEGFIIGMILLYSLSLACYDYSDRDETRHRNKMIEKSGVVFTIVFSIEALFKIIAMGFIAHRNSYLKDPWNWLDFTVVCIGVIEVTGILPAQDIKALRVLRILRPLRSVNSIPSMKRLITSLLGSLKKLFDSGIIMAFIFVLFGILGVRQFKGIPYQRCRTTQTPLIGATSWERADEDRLCSMEKGGGLFTCPAGTYCGRVMDYPHIPLSSENIKNQAEIAYGYMTFDHLGSAMLTIFQMITLEGWSDLMYALQDASTPWMAVMFCVLIVIIGSFFLLNLVLAVIVDTFDSQDRNREAQELKNARILRETKALYGIIDSDDEEIHIHKEYEDEVLLKPPVPRKPSRMSDEAESDSGSDQAVPERAQNNCLYRVFFVICTHSAFGFIMTLCTVLNTLILACDRYPMKKADNAELEFYNNILSLVFLTELFVKLIGLGCTQYASDAFNIFDCTIVCFSVIELSVGLLGVQSTGGALTSLRALRLLRVFKLARSWRSFRELLQTMITTLKDITHFSVLMLIFMFIYSLLGMEMFAYRIKFNGRNKDYPLNPIEVPDINTGWYPRSNFNTFLNAMVTVFGILIGENWNSTMYDHLRAGSRTAYVFFISLFIFGNLILLNLFLAILLKNFEEPLGQEEEDFEKELEQKDGLLERVRQGFLNLFSKNSQDQGDEVDMIDAPGSSRSNLEALLAKRDGIYQQNPSMGTDRGSLSESPQLRQPTEEVSPDPRGELNQTTAGGAVDESPRGGMETDRSVRLTERAAILRRSNSQFSIGKIKTLEKKKLEPKKNRKINLEGETLFIFGPVSGVRNICVGIIGNPVFDHFILLVIGFSSILLTFEGPLLDPNGREAGILAALDKAVTWIFIAECVFKVIVYGLIANGKNSYLRNSWNILDFCIVVMSTTLLVIQDSKSVKHIKILRMLRVLRPLRMIARNPGMSIVVKSMLNAIPDILNVMVVSLLFLVLFAILGTNLYKGSFFYCLTDNVPPVFRGRIRDKYDCLDFGGDWVNKDQNFDNVMTASLTLFNVMTTEGWLQVMWDAVDSDKVDKMPILSNNMLNVFFFVFFMLMGSLFILNMFVGVVISVFNVQKERLELGHLLTQLQRDWCDCLINIYKSEPVAVYRETGDKIKDFCHATVSYWLFDTIIMACILMNTVCLALTWYDEPEVLPKVLKQIGVVFNILYTVEALMKIIAFGPKYFDNNWNMFDFLVVLVTWAERIAKYALGASQGSQTAVIRTLRVSRVFKVLKKLKNLRILFNTFIDALPQLTNVGALLFLFLFIYSVLGVFLFGHVKLQATLNVHANFQTFGTALLTLFRMSTGESWNFIMYDSARQKSITYDCKNDQTYKERVQGMEGCGTRQGATYLYFLSFMVIVSFIFLNLFIVIIFESFENSQAVERLKINQFTVDIFVQLWSKFDPAALYLIHQKDLPKLIELILEEEIRQIEELRQNVKDGEIEEEEFKNSNFMFNLYRDLALVDVTAIKYEGKSTVDQDRDTPEAKAEKLRIRRIMAKAMQLFIAHMKLPAYRTEGQLRFYYYDVLEGLSRNLFQNLLFDAREEKLKHEPWWYEQQSDDNESVASFSSAGTIYQNESDDELESVDSDAQERVNTAHIVRGDLEFILYKLEQAGKKKNILKYNTMQHLRARKMHKSLLTQLASFRDQIHDSSHVHAAAVIQRHFGIWQKKKEAKRKMESELLAMMGRSFHAPEAVVKENVATVEVEDLAEEFERSQSPAHAKVDDFVDTCFYALQLDPTRDQISRLACAQLFYELMLGHRYGEDWDDKEFNTIYNLFQDDEADDKSDDGLDAHEFKRLIKRIAQV